MNITDVKVFPVEEEKLKAYATITFDNCFIVRDLKVISGNKGFFIAMPSKKRKDGTFRDVAHPLNSETRKLIEEAVLRVYEQEAGSIVHPASLEVDDDPVQNLDANVSDNTAEVSEDTAVETIPPNEEAIPSDTETSDPAPVENAEPEHLPTDNPTFEASDDPEKAFSYEE